MPYRLIKGIYAVRCRHPQCPFNDQIKVEHFISGVTEDDVRTEALKVARDQARVKHDSIFGRRSHGLQTPDIRMVSGTIQRIPGGISGHGREARGADIRMFAKGDLIIRKGEAASTVCEIVEGSAYPAANPRHRYHPGDCFGVSALVPNHRRMSDVIAQEDGTVVAFHNLVTMRQTEPGKASQVFVHLMEDTLQVVDELGKAAGRVRKGKHRIAS